MREARRQLMFADEDLQAKRRRDAVTPAQRSPAALQKITERTLEDGSAVHSFRTLLDELSTIVRNTCVTRSTKTASPALQMVTTSTPAQRRALHLLQQITVSSATGQQMLLQPPIYHEITHPPSGNFSLMFAVDYPYECTEQAARWFNATPISDQDRRPIGRNNARRLFRLN
jgi:hypothetical protein